MTSIVCLGWGSLIWDPRTLLLASGWYPDGPQLGLEFGRQSSDGRITLVLNPSSPPVQVLWARLASASLSQAVADLAAREGTTVRNIGVWPAKPPGSAMAEQIGLWAKRHGVDAAVWTALPPKFDGVTGRMPSKEEVLHYLNSLTGEKRDRAEQYLRRAPAQIRTGYRSAIEQRLGWTASETV